MNRELVGADDKNTPLLINTIAQAAFARNAISFCYLCGEPLPRTRKERKATVDREHIIPSAARGPSQLSSDWSPILDVHRHCHQEIKNVGEESLHLWHTMMTRSPGEWPKEINQLLPEHSVLIPPGEDKPRLVLTGIGKLRSTVWHWARGFHTLLYHEFLDRKTLGSIIPPVPGYTYRNTSETDHTPTNIETVADTDALSGKIRNLLRGALDRNECDGVLAWGNRVRYACRWCPPDSGQKTYLCVWAIELDHFGSIRRNEGWQIRPWHGSYVTNTLPARATLATLID